MSEQDLREEIVRIVEELYEAHLITPTGGNVSARL
ncbi:MAG TPA: class II aldolase/adducin family protein, partial [Anaerolineae bacterium]|nr:class II aldolase/adducin family protein [Anaerolineae bacterium]